MALAPSWTYPSAMFPTRRTTEIRLDQSRTIDTNTARLAVDPTLLSISLYLALSPRPTRRWVRAFKAALARLNGSPRWSYELIGGTRTHNRRGLGRWLPGGRGWIPRIFYRGPTHLIVHNCDPDADAVRAFIERIRDVARATDLALVQPSPQPPCERSARDEARRRLEEILVQSERVEPARKQAEKRRGKGRKKGRQRALAR
jgi:hypothetical protein